MTQRLQPVWDRIKKSRQETRPGQQRLRRRRQLQNHVESLEDRRLLAGDAGFVSLDQTRELADHAAGLWAAAGATPEQVDALENLRYEIADLGEHKLASYQSGKITIDDNAAGHLWFVDQTPLFNEEFTVVADEATSLTAMSGTLAYAKMDLLSALLHEQGHALGLEGSVQAEQDVMGDALALGVRRLPEPGQAQDAMPGSLDRVEYLTSATTGDGVAFNNHGPFASTNYVIALQGTFPTENLSSEPLIGSVEMFAGNFAPRGFALAQGQLLPIAENSALFSIIGNNFGGDGETVFALPDLRGRVPIGSGQGPGLSDYELGDSGGFAGITLTEQQIPAHSHSVANSVDTSATGGNQQFDNRQPYLALTPVVSLIGTFPSENLSTESLIGSIDWFAGDFAPRGTAIADGSLLPITNNTTLFSLFGTTFGGDGESTFALPDLRGRMAVHAGDTAGPGLSQVRLGQRGGTEFVTLSESQLPSHNHGIPSTSGSTGNTGGGQSFDNRSPWLALNYNVAIVGVFPSRSLEGEGPIVPDSGTEGTGFVSGTDLLEEAIALPLIDTLVQAGIDRWTAVGIDQTQVSLLQSVDIQLRDLPSGTLATATDDVITLDRDASNRGWFIDVSPLDDVEFGEIDPRTGELVGSQNASERHYDLLTTIMHEQGHILGLDHSFEIGDLMYGSLSIGGRKLPTVSDVATIGTGDHDHDHDDHDHGLPHSLSGGSDPFIAGIGISGLNFAPRGWAFTDGQTLPINQHQALFSLIGTSYGGDGRTTFQLPDFRGRGVMGTQSPRDVAVRGGIGDLTLTTANLPAHAHEVTLPAISATINLPDGGGTFILIRDGDDLVVTLDGTEVNRVPAGVLEELTINGADAGDDNLQVDFSPTNPVDGIAVTFNGGAGGNDSLTLLNVGGTTAMTFQNENDGSVRLDTLGVDITYTGLEPITMTGATDLVLNYIETTGGETITIQDDIATPGSILVDSTQGEFARLDVTTLNSLTINAGDGDDRIELFSLDASFDADLFINGDADTDTLNINSGSGAIDLGTGSLVVDAEAIDLTTGRVEVLTDGGDLNFGSAAIMINADVTLDTEQGNDGDAGAVTLGAIADLGSNNFSQNLSIDASTAGGNDGSVSLDSIDSPGSLNVDAGDGVITLGGDISAGIDPFGGSPIPLTLVGDVRLTTTVSLTSIGLLGFGGEVDLSSASVSATAPGIGLTVTALADRSDGGSIELGTLADAGGAFLDSVVITASNSSSNVGVINVGGQLSVVAPVSLNSGELNLGAMSSILPVDNLPGSNNGMVSDTIVLVQNDGVDAINGEFSNQAEGSTVNFDGVPYVLTYFGGTGNDVVMTFLSPVPDRFVVTTAVDENDGTADPGTGAGTSLREAIIAANANSNLTTITFDPSLDGTPIELTLSGSGEDASATGDLDITSEIIIQGNGPTNTIIDGGFDRDTMAAGNRDRVLEVRGGGNLTVNQVTLIGGNAGSTQGGGILVNPAGIAELNQVLLTGNAARQGGGAMVLPEAQLTVNNSTISENFTPPFGSGGGGVSSAGILTLSSSTVSGNSARQGGGIDVYGSVATITNTTITNNTSNQGGGIRQTDSTVQVSNSIVAENSASSAGADLFGSFQSFGSNLIGDGDSSTGFSNGIIGDQVGSSSGAGLIAPGLAALADNGGSTPTHALLPGSPAIDTGSSTEVNDQRGAPFLRNVGGGMDIGALERQSIDFGDAPLDYPTLVADGGASHQAVGPRLGDVRDGEIDGQPSAGADGDGSDDDGVLFGGIVPGAMAGINIDLQNATELGASVDAWIDFNQNGDWDDEGEHILISRGVVGGLQTLNFDVPSGASLGSTVARVRVSTMGGLSPTGPAADGEVEDYRVIVGADPGTVTINAGRVTRSEITSIEVQFDGLAEVLPTDFVLQNTNGESVTGIAVATDNTSGSTLATLTFTGGPSVVTGTSTAVLPPTLADGVYNLRYRPTGQTLIDNFFRTYGDTDGDDATNVGLIDFAAFRGAFDSGFGEDAFNSGLDADRSGTIGLIDFAAFRSNFGT